MRKNILLVFICSFFFLPAFVKADSVSDILPKNNFDIIEFDRNTNKPKLVDPSDNAKKILDTVKKEAEEKENQKKKEAENSKLTYENYKSKMSDLTSKVYFDKKFFGFDSNVNYFFNSLVQSVFWFGKLVFYVVAEVYIAIEGMSDVSGLLNETVRNSSKVFSSLFSQEIIYMVGASMAVYLLYLFATGKGSFFKILIKMLLIYTCIGVYFIQLSVNDQNKYLITHVYDSFRTTTITLNGEITKTLTGESKNGIETYFSETLLKGYKYMNSPVKEDGSFLLSEKEFEDLAGYKQGDGDHLVGDKKVKDLAKDKDPENKMLKNEWGLKFMYAFASDVDIIVMGTIYLLLGLSRFFFLIVFIFLIVLLPFILLLSLFPKMEHLLIGFNKKGISMLALSSIMLLATSIFSFFYNTLTGFISTAVGGDLLVTVFLKGVLLFLMWKYRHSLLSAFSRVTNNPVGKIGREISNSQSVQKLKERLSKSAKFGLQSGKDSFKVGGQFVRGSLKMGKNTLQTRLKDLRKESKEQSHSLSPHSLDMKELSNAGISRTIDSVRDNFSIIRTGTMGTVSAAKEKSNRSIAFLYKIRASSFKDKESTEFKKLKEKRKTFINKANNQQIRQKAYRQEVKRLMERRLGSKIVDPKPSSNQRESRSQSLKKFAKRKTKKVSKRKNIECSERSEKNVKEIEKQKLNKKIKLKRGNK